MSRGTRTKLLTAACLLAAMAACGPEAAPEPAPRIADGGGVDPQGPTPVEPPQTDDAVTGSGPLRVHTISDEDGAGVRTLRVFVYDGEGQLIAVQHSIDDRAQEQTELGWHAGVQTHARRGTRVDRFRFGSDGLERADRAFDAVVAESVRWTFEKGMVARMETTTTAGTSTTIYRYTGDGRLTTTAVAQNNGPETPALSLVYDDALRLRRIDAHNGQSYVYVLDGSNRLTRVDGGGLQWHLTYAPFGRLKTVTVVAEDDESVVSKQTFFWEEGPRPGLDVLADIPHAAFFDLAGRPLRFGTAAPAWLRVF